MAIEIVCEIIVWPLLWPGPGALATSVGEEAGTQRGSRLGYWHPKLFYQYARYQGKVLASSKYSINLLDPGPGNGI